MKWKAKGLLAAFFIMLILFILTFFISAEKNTFSVCPTKLIAGVRCPLCGMGKSFSFISHGHFKNVLSTNKSAFFFYPLYLISLYLILIAFFSANGFSKLPGKRILDGVIKHPIKIILALFSIAFAFYIYDIITNSGEKFFDFNYTIYSLFKRN